MEQRRHRLDNGVQGWGSALQWDESARAPRLQAWAPGRSRGPSRSGTRDERSPLYWPGSTTANATMTAGAYGHVGYVRGVYPDGSVSVEHYNGTGDRKYSISRVRAPRYLYVSVPAPRLTVAAGPTRPGGQRTGDLRSRTGPAPAPVGVRPRRIAGPAQEVRRGRRPHEHCSLDRAEHGPPATRRRPGPAVRRDAGPPPSRRRRADDAPAPALDAPPLPLSVQREQLRPPSAPLMTGEQMSALLRAVGDGHRSRHRSRAGLSCAPSRRPAPRRRPGPRHRAARAASAASRRAGARASRWWSRRSTAGCRRRS